MAYFPAVYFPSGYYPPGQFSSGGGGGGGSATLTTDQLRGLLGLPAVPDGAVDEEAEQRQLLSYPGPFTSQTITIATPTHDLGVITLFDLTIDSYVAGTTYHYSNFYHDTFTEYAPRLLEHAQIAIGLPDLFNGIPGSRSATVRGANLDPTNTEAPSLAYLLANVSDIRGSRARVRLYSLTLQQDILVLDGTVSEYDDGESEWSITIETEESSIFDVDLPKRRLRDIYPDIDLTSGKGQDPPVIVVHGTMRRVPLFLVETEADFLYEDVIFYRYGAIRSAEAGTLTIANVYRDGALVDPAEYIVTQSPAGLTVVQFDLDQRDASGRNLPILVDIVSSEFNENPATIAAFWLRDSTYGLGQSIDATLTALAVLDYVAVGQRASGGVNQLINAKALFPLFLLHGAYLARNESGEYYPVVDTVDKHPQPDDDVLQLGQNDSGGWLNLLSIENQFHRRTDEMFKSLTIKGIFDNGFTGQDSAYLATVLRSRSGQGIVKEIENPMIGDVATLDREVDYLFKRWNAQDRGLSVVTTSETYVADLGTVIKVTIPSKSISGTVFEIREKGSLGGESCAFHLLLSGYDATSFTYEPQDAVVSPLATVLTDYRQTPPEAPTNFVVNETIVQTGTEGIVESLVQMQADAPAVNVTHLVFQSFRASSSIPRSEVTVAVDPGDTAVKAELPLTPGLIYDLECYALNVNNNDGRQESARAIIANHVALGDEIAPNPPIALTVTHGTGKTLSLDWDDNTEEDFKYYAVERDTDPTFATVTHLANASASRFIDSQTAYETTYYYRVRAVDYSGNTSGYSNTAVGYTAKLASFDYGSASVHSQHRQSLNIIYFAFTIGAHESFSQDTGLDAQSYLYTAGATGVQATDEWDSSTFMGDVPNGTRLFFIFASGPDAGPFDADYHLGFWNGTDAEWSGGGRINGW